MDNSTMNTEHIDAVATTATKVTLGGAGSTILFGLTAGESGAYWADKVKW